MLASARLGAALVASLVVLIAPSAGSAGPSDSTRDATRLQSAILAQVNAVRAGRGLARLRLARGLSAAAGRHSAQMTRLGFFSHSSANGGSFSQRIVRFYPARGFRAWSVGENLLWAAPDVGARRAVAMWMASPPHRANLLSPRWREIGIAAVHSSSAPGVYGGRPVTVVTADFGARTR
jgi:uncharacterized protein YkwD